MDHVANVNTDSHLDLAVRGSIGIAMGERSLNFNRALRCFQRTPEFDQERIPDRFNLSAVKPRKDFAKQLAMFLQQFLGKLFVPLAQRAVAHHVGEHDRGQLALLIGAHFRVSAFPNSRLRRDTMLAQLRISCPDDKGRATRQAIAICSAVFAPSRVPGKRRGSLTAVDHLWTLKSTEYWVVSQVTFIVPPPLGLLSIAMAS
jgi:hypothetical protein